MSRNPDPGGNARRHGRRPLVAHRPFSWIRLAALAGSLSLAATPHPPSAAQLIELLASPDFSERQQAMDGLAAHRASAEALAPALREKLHAEDQEARQRAAIALAALGVAEAPVIDELLAGMGRRVRHRYLAQPEPAIGSMTALVKLGPSAVPALVKAMEDEAYDSRDLAVEALGRIGPDARDAVPALVRQCDAGNVPEKCRAVEAKWKIDGDAAFARERVVPLLDEKAGRECNGAVKTLEVLGRDAVPALPALIAALKRHQSVGILWTVASLAPHAPEPALAALREALDMPALADYAAPELQNLGEPSAPLIAHQLKRLKACAPQDGTDPMRIVYTIVIHGPEAKGALGELTALLKHDTPAVRQAAAWGLPRIFAEDAPVIAALQEALNDPAAAEEAARSLKMIEVARQ